MKNIIFSICLLTVIIPKAHSQTFSWAQGLSGVNGIGVMTFDANNNIYSIGGFKGTIDFDPGLGVLNLTAIGNVAGDMFVRKQDSLGNLIWVKQFAAISSGVTLCYGKSINTDGAGNVYIAGVFRDSFDFDPGLPVYKLSSFGGYHSFVLKLDSSGNFVWVKDMGAQGAVGNMSLLTAAFDKLGNIYFAASIGGTATPIPIDVDPGPAVYSITSTAISGNDFIVEKLDSAGNFKWVKQITGAHDKDAVSIVLDTVSNIYITGGFADTVDFDPGPGIAKLYSGSSSNAAQAVFIAKYDSSGNFNWVKQIGVAGNNPGAGGISLDPIGNVFVTGHFGSIVDFDPGPGTYSLTSNSTRSIFTLKLGNNGDFAWAKMMGAPAGLFEGRAITTDSMGNVYTAAVAPGGCDADPGTATYYVGGDCVLQKLDSAGNFVWGAGWQGDIPGWIGLDHSNNVYTTGTFSGLNKDFDPGANTFLLSGSSTSSGFILKLTQGETNGIANHENLSRAINVYPNPSAGVFRFSSASVIDRIEITDLTGKTVFLKEPRKKETSIDISGNVSGVYFYRIVSRQKQLEGKLVLFKN